MYGRYHFVPQTCTNKSTKVKQKYLYYLREKIVLSTCSMVALFNLHDHPVI